MVAPESLTPLSVAFIWHMHQPDYKDDLTGEYLMPWVRLHAIKDYLDMVAVLERYPKIRQTFNLVPSLIDQLEDYCRPETRDKYLTITLKEQLTDEDKRFILARFFDAAPDTMIQRSPYYYSLLERRNRLMEQDNPDISAFTDQEYFDITALFNLVWFDPLWVQRNQPLKQLWDKQCQYTLADRTRLIEMQRDLIAQVLPTYRAFQEKRQIEVTTTPYYHPILPLLIDSDSARVAMPDAILPDVRFQHPEDAEYHVKAAKTRYQELFGTDPLGMWPSEQSVSPATIDLIRKYNFQWAVTSEGILSRSLNLSFEKDHFGNIHNVEILCQPYQYNGVKLLFRHLTLSDLIGFHYSKMAPDQAARDFIHRLKMIQRRCTAVGLKYPIVTIALDGENCWEFFPEDGHAFLEAVYTQLSTDPSFNVCRVRDYLEQLPEGAVHPLPHLHSGSWINSNFHIWIADPVKNAAWVYLKKTRDDLAYLTQTGHYTPELLEQAWKEIYIAEGSDWFWWYGEPHNSGQDEIFDMQFRRHLANIYRLVDREIPNYLTIPLSVTMGRPVTMPTGPICPHITGRSATLSEWTHAGCLELTHGAMHRATQVLNKVHFGSDDTNFYVRFDLNKDALTPYHEIFLYFCTPGKTRHNSPIRIKSPHGVTVPTQRYHYAYEIQISNLAGSEVMIACAEAMPDHLWMHRTDLVKDVAFQDVLELALPFDPFNTHMEEYLQFSVAVVQGGVLESFQPENFILSVQRHAHHAYCQMAHPPMESAV